MFADTVRVVLREEFNASIARQDSAMQLRKILPALTLAIGVAAASGAVLLRPALASLPVPKTYIGCVSNGEFKNEDGYVIRIRHPGGALMDLSQWEKKMLRISGHLLPSDNFYLNAAPVVVGPCR